jgi:hypothetical protein
MRSKTLCCSALLVLALVAPAAADSHMEKQAADAASQQQPQMSAEEQAMMKAWEEASAVRDEHKRLAEGAGTWKSKVTMWMKPGAEPMVSEGTAKRSVAMDGRVLVESFEGSFMGQPFKGHGMYGYDNVTGKHWSTWNDNMSTGVMVSQGTADAQGVVTLTGEFMDPMTKKMMKMRTVVQHPSADKEVVEMYQEHEGKEFKCMEIVSERVKG